MKQRNMEKAIDYKKYNLTIREMVYSMIVGTSIIYGVSYVFFNSIVAFLLLLPILIIFVKCFKNYLCKKRISELKHQFMDMCISISAQLTAGYSLESSIRECLIEMQNMYGSSSYICCELNNIISQLSYNVNIEESFDDFARRTNIEDIYLFAEVIKITKRNGGNMIVVVKKAADNIHQKIEVEREIETIINEKKFEQYIMNFVPIIIILFLKVTANDIVKTLYTTVIGKVLMSLCILIYGLTLILENKIMNIKI